MKRMKQILASVLVAVMVIAGLMITPLDASAAETATEENGVTYVLDTAKYNFASFWNEDASKRTAPTRDGYVFGGWYKDVEGTKKAITETEAAEITDASDVWAKFVPAEVLSIRAQLEKTTEAANGVDVASSYLRLLSGVNGLDYQKVGFDILYNKRTADTAENQEIATNITKVFSKLTNDETAEDGMVASELFGEAATHFSVLRLDQIKAKNFGLVIYVTPQWTTLDGTLVEGQSKYVRVMDGYADNRYISVPVNLISGDPVGAGQLKLKYDTRLEVVGFDSGLLMTEMSYYDNKSGNINIVGNIAGTANVDPEQDIYANVWFKVKEGVSLSDDLKFDVEKLQFCNCEEVFVTNVQAWDVIYPQ